MYFLIKLVIANTFCRNVADQNWESSRPWWSLLIDSSALKINNVAFHIKYEVSMNKPVAGRTIHNDVGRQSRQTRDDKSMTNAK